MLSYYLPCNHIHKQKRSNPQVIKLKSKYKKKPFEKILIKTQSSLAFKVLALFSLLWWHYCIIIQHSFEKCVYFSKTFYLALIGRNPQNELRAIRLCLYVGKENQSDWLKKKQPRRNRKKRK